VPPENAGPWLLTGLHAAKEGLEGPVQPRQDILQHLRVDVVVLRPYLLDGRQLRALVGAGDAHPAFPPGITPLLESSIVEFSAAPQDKQQLLLLFSGGQKFIFERLADTAWC
jgi:hypothetical protein